MGKNFLGQGMGFPVELANGEVTSGTEEAKVQQSILVILGTAKGERVMRPDFGSRLHELTFEPVSSALTRGRVVQYVTEALLQWESRVELLKVDVTVDPRTSGRLLVDIEYKVRATNSIFNLVYPFYLREGSNAGAQA